MTTTKELSVEEKQQIEQIITALAHCTGTENYYQLFDNIVYTDGAKTMAELCQAYWLIQLIAINQQRARRHEELKHFQVWKLNRYESGHGAKIECEDGNRNEFITININCTDFPLEEIKLYVQPNEKYIVIFLPSEY
jgi:hypothetical protein